MTHELILTSVAQGLGPTDHGFCPVAVDSALSQRVHRYLLSLSDYEKVLSKPKGSDLRKPGVFYSHLILPGELEHVVTRVADAGLDYRKQPNLLVHHIVLDTIDAPPEGPAWLCALPGFHFSEWHGTPIQFKRGRPIPTLTNPLSLTRRQQIARQYRWLDPLKMALTGAVDTSSDEFYAEVQNNNQQITLVAPPTTPCPVWEELTGDAGWGGVLAETAFTKQPIVLIYNPDQNVLPLFVEALALLPPYVSWQVTFCTHFTGLPPTIPCQWKAVLAGSYEAVLLAQDFNNMVLDITKPLREAPAGKYVDFARHGQEYMVPLTLEENAFSLTDTETKPYGEESAQGTTKVNESSTPIPISSPPPPLVIRLPQKRTGWYEFLLRRTSRFQFYFLYSIMFVLVLVLLVLAIDQAGQFGLLQRLREGNQPAAVERDNTVLDNPAPIVESELEAEGEPPEPVVAAVEPNHSLKTFEENRQKQKELLLPFWETFVPPVFFAVNLPVVHETLIDLPEKTTFTELRALLPFGAALELQFIPLFELPKANVETRLDLDALPELVWNVNAVDSDTQESTVMFSFHLTESGLTMNWQKEGLNHQSLYDTILSSLGFLQLSVVGMPETVREIPLFAPVYATPMKASDLAGLSELDKPEIAVELPLASELWQPVFAEKKPPLTLRLVVRAEPMDSGMQIKSTSESEYVIEIPSHQQSGKLTESGETVFENIILPFSVSASLEKVVWTGTEYVSQLLSEQENIKRIRAELTQKIDRIKEKIFSGGLNEADRSEQEACETEQKKCDTRLVEIESLVQKLPAAYKEIQQNETWCFHYSVFLESSVHKRRLLLLTTE